MQKGRCLEAETAWANQSTEKPGTLSKKPVSQREDAITQKRLSQIVPASAVMDGAMLPCCCCLSASPVPMLGDARQRGEPGCRRDWSPSPSSYLQAVLRPKRNAFLSTVLL